MPSLINLFNRVKPNWRPSSKQIDCYIELVKELIGKENVLCGEYMGDYDGKVAIVIRIPHHSPYPFGLITYRYGSVGGRDEIGMINENGNEIDEYRELGYRLLSAVEVFSSMKELKDWLKQDESLESVRMVDLLDQLEDLEINLDISDNFSKKTDLGFE